MDTCRSWVIASASTFIFGVNVGTAKLASLLYVASITRYGTNRKSASLPYSLCFAMRNIVGPLVGCLSQRFGLREVTLFGCFLSSVAIAVSFFVEDIVVLTISWGFIYGVGFGMSTTLLPEILTHHFSKHLGKAYGLYFLGSCAGSALLPVICNVLLKEYGISGSFLIIAGIILNTVPASMILEKRKSKSNNRNSVKEVNINKEETFICVCDKSCAKCASEKKTFDEVCSHFQVSDTTKGKCSSLNSLSVFKDPAFMLILFTQSSYFFIMVMIFTVIIDFAMDIGVDSSNEIHILLCLSLPDILGRIVFGWISDGGYATTNNFCGYSYLGCGISCILLAVSTGFGMLMVAVLFFGLMAGSLITIFPRVICENIEKKNLTMALASRYFLHPAMSALMSPLIGYFRGTLQSYRGIFYILAIQCFFCAFLVFLTPLAARYRTKRQVKELKQEEENPMLPFTSSVAENGVNK